MHKLSWLQEMSSVNCPILRSENSHLLKYLMIERTYKERTRKYFRRLGKENEILVVPYPTFVHYDATRKLGDDTFNVLSKRKRNIYVYMAASLKRSDLRHALAVSHINHSFIILRQILLISLSCIKMSLLQISMHFILESAKTTSVEYRKKVYSSNYVLYPQCVEVLYWLILPISFRITLGAPFTNMV